MKTILMSMRVTEAQNYIEKRNSIAYDYIKFFEDLGYIVILIPNNTSNLEQYTNLSKASLIVLSGGNNVHPSLYTSAKQDITDSYLERDQLELNLIEHAIATKTPLLGVCKGAHIINCHFQGSLTIHLEGHVAKNHQLVTTNKEYLYLNKETTNSYHNQGIFPKDLAPCLQSIAQTEDGTIECFKHEKHSIMGIQWHPERQDKKFDKDLIINFIKEKL